MKSLLEIEQAIARLPRKSQRQLLRDIPSICPEVFPPEGWAGILAEAAPRSSFTALLDHLDAEYRTSPEQFPLLNEDTLADPK